MKTITTAKLSLLLTFLMVFSSAPSMAENNTLANINVGTYSAHPL